MTFTEIEESLGFRLGQRIEWTGLSEDTSLGTVVEINDFDLGVTVRWDSILGEKSYSLETMEKFTKIVGP